MQVGEALEHYLLQLRADGRSTHTTSQVERHGRLFATFVGERPIEEVGHGDVARFLTSAVAMRTPSGDAKKATSMNALRSSIRCFLAFVHAAGFTQANAGRLIKRARCGTPPPRALSDADRERLLTALATASTPAELRDRALFVTLLTCGLRIGSALGADVGDLDLDAGEIRLRHMKNGNEDTAFVPAATVALLRAYLGNRRVGPLFPGEDGRRLGARQAHRRLALWAGRAGIEGAVHPHRLRHSFAMAVYERTGDVLVTSRALCHRSIASTAVYARADRGNVRRAVGA